MSATLTPRRAHAHAHEAAPVGGPLVTPLTSTLGLLILVMCAVLVVRFARGVGAVTNLNDGYPWGIWIAYDVVTGSALAAGGFVTAFLTHVLNRGQYHPLVRPALIAALLGYVQAGVSVMFDLGRYMAFWHYFSPKYIQLNSVLFEVGICIMAYTVVLSIEFAPVVLERLGWTKANRVLSRALFFFVALGVVLPLMHQSSLGTLLVIYGTQVHPLYQTTMLPLLFLLSCVGLGMAAVVFEATLSSAGLRRPMEVEVLGPLMQIARGVLALFLVVRLADVVYRGVLPLALHLETRAVAFWVENALMAAPIVLLAGERARRSRRSLFLAAVTMILAGFAYRIDAFLVSIDTGAGWTYFPSLGEISVTVGLIAVEVLAIIIAVKLLPVLPRHESDAAAPAAGAR